jgi:hypothetical protein
MPFAKMSEMSLEDQANQIIVQLGRKRYAIEVKAYPLKDQPAEVIQIAEPKSPNNPDDAYHPEDEES